MTFTLVSRILLPSSSLLYPLRPPLAIANNLECRSCKKPFSSRSLGTYVCGVMKNIKNKNIKVFEGRFHQMKFSCPARECKGVAQVYVKFKIQDGRRNAEKTRSWGMEGCQWKTAVQIEEAGEWESTVICCDREDLRGNKFTLYPVGGIFTTYELTPQPRGRRPRISI